MTNNQDNYQKRMLLEEQQKETSQVGRTRKYTSRY